MAKYQIVVKCVDFNDQAEVNSFLRFLRENKAKVSAYDQKKPNFNTFAIITRYREKEQKTNG